MNEDGSIDSSHKYHSRTSFTLHYRCDTTTAVHSKAEARACLDFGGGGGGRQPLEGSGRQANQAEEVHGSHRYLGKQKEVFVLFVFIYLKKKNIETAKYTSRHSTKSTKANRFYKPKEIRSMRSVTVEVPRG